MGLGVCPISSCTTGDLESRTDPVRVDPGQLGSSLWKSPLKSWNGRSKDCSEAGYCWFRFAGTLGEVLSSFGNVKIRSERNTHISSQNELRRPRQGLKL
nr:hypothetical protein [Tanacetum cinerariifolium]